MSSSYHVRIEGDVNEDLPKNIRFSVGNPSVEHITGVLHLYRHNGTQACQGRSETPSQVCVLAVPGDMSFSEFSKFLGSYNDGISSMRLVRRDDKPNCACMALLQFRSGANAAEFVSEYNGKPFSMLEPDIICRAVLITEVTSDESLCSSNGEANQLTGGLVELPTCPVCLERLDRDISGIITTVCNHCFHNECLQKWGDSSCPVCRYCINRSPPSQCEVCDATADLWICLICGNVGCGRYKDAHARAHYESTHHCYALEVETGRVWDYSGDGYVHRLIQSNLDGKLVEVPSPEQPGLQSRGDQARSGPSGVGADGSHTGKGGPSGSCVGTSDQARAYDDFNMMEATYASKMDALNREYTHLLTSQLESQRQYFEELRAEQGWQHRQVLDSLEERLHNCQQAESAADDRARSAENTLRNLQKAHKELGASLRAARKEIETLNELNQSLIGNQQILKDKLVANNGAQKAQADEIKELRDQVRDLMVYLEASDIASGGSELAGGSVQIGAHKQRLRGRRNRRGEQ